MPLVFVHGVANRLDGAWLADADSRRALFTQYVTASWCRTDGDAVRIDQPYWGNHAASLAWGGASVPDGSRVAERFGGADEAEPLTGLLDQFLPHDARPRCRILDTARQSLGEAVDLLYAAALLAVPEAAEEIAAASAVALAVAADEPRPGWLEEVSDDEAFAVRLCRLVDERTAKAAPGRESFGLHRVRSAVHEGVVRVRDTVVDRVTAPMADRLRAELMPRVTEFLGDVLTYYRRRAETAGPIGVGIAEALRKAHAVREPSDPLVVVAHSMGGNIVYDLLTGTLAQEDLTVDALVTVGSQVAFFEELSLFAPHPVGVPGPAGLRLPKPPAVRRWINVYDTNDLLSFRTSPVFEDVEDHSFRSGRIRAHSAYFLLPSFYERLGERLNGRPPAACARRQDGAR
ncbi:hypothetical protein ACFY96_26250 [Streptomyces massasporeus]